MKDPFPPARAAGCRAMVDNIDQYEPKDIAFRVLPTICGLMVDPEKSVREGIFNILNSFRVFFSRFQRGAKVCGSSGRGFE